VLFCLFQTGYAVAGWPGPEHDSRPGLFLYEGASVRGASIGRVTEPRMHPGLDYVVLLSRSAEVDMNSSDAGVGGAHSSQPVNTELVIDYWQ